MALLPKWPVGWRLWLVTQAAIWRPDSAPTTPELRKCMPPMMRPKTTSSTI